MNVLMAVVLLAFFAGCGHKGPATLSTESAPPVAAGPPKLQLWMTASDSINNCGKPTPYFLNYKVLQLSDGASLNGLDRTRLWGNERSMLQTVLVRVSEPMRLNPGDIRQPFEEELDPKTRVVVVVGDFCKAGRDCWRHVSQRSGADGIAMELRVDASCMHPAGP